MCACIYIYVYIYMGELWIVWSLGKKFEAWLLTYRKHVSWRCVYLQKWQWRRNQARQHSQQCLNMGPSRWLSWEIWWSDQPLVFGCPIFRQTRIYINQQYPISNCMKAHRQLIPMVIWFSMAMEFDIWMMCSFPNSMMRPPSNVQLLDEFLMACMFFLFSNEKGRKRIVLSIRVQVLGFDKSLIQMIQPIHTYISIHYISSHLKGSAWIVQVLSK